MPLLRKYLANGFDHSDQMRFYRDQQLDQIRSYLYESCRMVPKWITGVLAILVVEGEIEIENCD